MAIVHLNNNSYTKQMENKMETTQCKLNPELVKELDKLKIKNLDLTTEDAEFEIDQFVSSNEAKLEKIISKYFPEVSRGLKWADHFAIDYLCNLEGIRDLFTDEDIKDGELNTFLSFADECAVDERKVQETMELIEEMPTMSGFIGFVFREYLEFKTELNYKKVV